MEEDWQIGLSSKASSASSEKSEQIRILNDKLLSESLSRRETGDLYKRLQEEYDVLLAKHAQAENTIDQLRIGARVDLFSDGPSQKQAVESKIIEFKLAPQPISHSTKSKRASISGSHQHELLTNAPVISELKEGARKPSLASNNPGDDKLDVALRLKDLQNDIAAFQDAIAERELSFEQQRNLYNALKDKHDSLQADIQRVDQGRGSKSQGIDPLIRHPNNFIDPNSMESELYRLELRLGEICDDIGEQLFSGRDGRNENDELVKALRDDFQRMRTNSRSPEQIIQQEHPVPSAVARQSSSVSSAHHSRSSRSETIASEPSCNGSSFTGHAGSSSPNEKKQHSTEDLAESGYYASESITKESPRRNSVKVPQRFLTRSISPDHKHFPASNTKRHWSLTDLQPHVESADELIIYSSEESELHRSYPDVTNSADANKRLHDQLDGGPYDSTDGLNDQNPDNDRARSHSHRRSSTQSRASNNGKETLLVETHHTGPVATSSPLEEHQNTSNHFSRSGKGNKSTVSSERTSSRPRRLRSGRPPSSNRTSTAWAPHHRDSFTDMRKSSRPGSRISKSSKSKQPGSSSGESCSNTRPDRVNSSVYSEQDKVPSLVNQPKGNIYGLRNRPYTADSNGDSGFVGSEGTLRSQELLNGGKPSVFNNGRTKVVKPVVEQYSRSLTQDVPDAGLRIDPADETHRESIASDRKHPRNSQKSRVPRRDQKTLLQPETWESYSVPETGSSGPANNSAKLRELSIASEDGMSMDSIRFPLPRQRASIHAEDSSPLRSSKLVGDGYRVDHDNTRERLKPQRDRQVKRPSFASAEPRLSVIYQEDDSYARLPSSRTQKTRRSSVDDDRRSRRLGHKSDHSVGGRQRVLSLNTTEDYSEVSKFKPEHIARSYSVEPLRAELQVLRNELAKLSRAQASQNTRPEETRLQNGRRIDDRPRSDPPRNKIYEELKQKITDLNEQLDRPINPDYDRKTNIEPNYKRNIDEHRRAVEELKNKLDTLANEVRRKNDFRPNESSTLLTTQRLTSTEAPQSILRSNHQREQPQQQPTHVSPSVAPVCPICSGLGYHRHGDYIFPRDFLESQSRVEYIPSRASPAPITLVNQSPKILTSTPYPAVQRPTHYVEQYGSPVNLNAVPTSYRLVPDVSSPVSTPVYPAANTIHHIHTFHGNRRSQSPPSSDYSSNDEGSRRRSRGRSKSRSRGRTRPRSIAKLDDWQLNDSLNEANRAASNMQRISKRMLNTIATDLINSGYSEL